MFHFYILYKYQKTSGFPTFSVGIEMEHWCEINLYVAIASYL